MFDPDELKKFLPENDKKVSDVKTPRVKKLIRKSAIKARNKIRDLIAEDEMMTVSDIILGLKKVRVYLTRVCINGHIRALRDEGNPNAIKRLEKYIAKREQGLHLRKRIVDWVQANPGCTIREVCEEFAVSDKQAIRVREHMRTHKIPGKWDVKPVVISRTMRKRRVMDFMMINPNATQPEIAAGTEIPIGSLPNIIRELDFTLNSEICEKKSIFTNFVLEELLLTKDTCDQRLAQLKSASQGARYIELRLQTLKQIQSILQLGNNDAAIHVNVTLDKDQRDAAGQAVQEAIVIEKTLELPDFASKGDS